MNDISLLSALLIGLAGGVHCVGMCGGIVGALTFAIPANKAKLPYLLAYNAGRIISYVAAGALAGGLGAIVSHQAQFGVTVLTLLSGVFLILMACYLGNWWRGLVYLERLGGGLFKRLSPLGKRFIPFKTPWHALPYGIIWGWLPCGLVYSTLTWSLASGSATQGALVMGSFGLGTLPTLLALGGVGNSIKQLFSHPVFRQIVASTMALFGLIFMYSALHNG